MGNAKRAALRAAVVNTVKARVKEADETSRADILDQLDAGDRLTARYKGQVLAAVAVAHGKVTPSVVDAEKFAAWCAEHYPTEVDMKPVVRPAFVSAVLQASKEAGQPCTPDGTLDVPGVVVREGDPYVVVTPTAEAKDIVAGMVADGYVQPTGELKMLEGEQ
jgi:hypothetical protein